LHYTIDDLIAVGSKNTQHGVANEHPHRKHEKAIVQQRRKASGKTCARVGGFVGVGLDAAFVVGLRILSVQLGCSQARLVTQMAFILRYYGC